MRTFTTTHTVYNFDELSDMAKQNAIQVWIENDDLPFLEEDMKYKLMDLLDEHKLKADGTPEVHYDLSYSQGAGAMFTGEFTWKGRYVVDIRHVGMYSHYNSKHITLRTLKGNDVNDKVFDEFTALYEKMARELEKYGYGLIEDACDPENVADLLRANEYEFNEDGTLA